MAITLTDGSGTISTTEFFLASNSTTATYQTADRCLQLFIDLSAMQAGDTYVLRFYEKVNAGTPRVFSTTTYTNAQAVPNKASDQYVLGDGWEISLQRTAGTDRSIAWSIRTVS